MSDVSRSEVCAMSGILHANETSHFVGLVSPHSMGLSSHGSRSDVCAMIVTGLCMCLREHKVCAM